MNVHIIVRDVPGERDRILPRLARLLASATGWTMSGKPNPRADLNYAMPYLDARHWRKRDDQPLAGYFTHREDILPPKVRMWHEQARRSVLRITSARQYAPELAEYGPTRVVAPPLDREEFRPALGSRRPGGRLVAGVSGFTYSGGRKGEALLAEVLQAAEARAYDWRAVGRGWPVRTSRIAADELPEWYRSLDLYVCPSLIEGIPYGPLEALACGVPVVIPRGVGLLDELPSLPGIVRYDCGDAAGLARSLDEARALIQERAIDRDALRAATEPFTEEGWITGHLDAFASLGLSENPSTRPALSDHGIFVVAYGEPARRCAERLIASVREHMPGTEVAVASDEPLPCADINIYFPNYPEEYAAGRRADLGGRAAKTKMWELAPREWQRVLYLDADTELTADVSFLFDALAAGWEMVCTKDVDGYELIHALWRRDSKEHKLGWQTIGSDRALQLAGGVVGFRRTEATQRFLNAWYDEWYLLARRDQGALLRALYREPVRVLVLGNEWNSFEGIFRGESAGIRHHRGGPARRVHRWATGRLDEPAAFRQGAPNDGVGIRTERSTHRPIRYVEQGVGVRARDVTLSGRTAVVTYTGASRVRRAAGLASRAYVFHKGMPLRVYQEDVAEVTRGAPGCWLVEEPEVYTNGAPSPMRMEAGVGVRERAR